MVKKMVIKVKLDKVVQNMMSYQNDYVFVVFEDHTFTLINIQKIFDINPYYQEIDPKEKIYKPY